MKLRHKKPMNSYKTDLIDDSNEFLEDDFRQQNLPVRKFLDPKAQEMSRMARTLVTFIRNINDDFQSRRNFQSDKNVPSNDPFKDLEPLGKNYLKQLNLYFQNHTLRKNNHSINRNRLQNQPIIHAQKAKPSELNIPPNEPKKLSEASNIKPNSKITQDRATINANQPNTSNQNISSSGGSFNSNLKNNKYDQSSNVNSGRNIQNKPVQQGPSQSSYPNQTNQILFKMMPMNPLMTQLCQHNLNLQQQQSRQKSKEQIQNTNVNTNPNMNINMNASSQQPNPLVLQNQKALMNLIMNMPNSNLMNNQSYITMLNNLRTLQSQGNSNLPASMIAQLAQKMMAQGGGNNTFMNPNMNMSMPNSTVNNLNFTQNNNLQSNLMNLANFQQNLQSLQRNTNMNFQQPQKQPQQQSNIVQPKLQHQPKLQYSKSQQEMKYSSQPKIKTVPSQNPNLNPSYLANRIGPVTPTKQKVQNQTQNFVNPIQTKPQSAFGSSYSPQPQQKNTQQQSNKPKLISSNQQSPSSQQAPPNQQIPSSQSINNQNPVFGLNNSNYFQYLSSNNPQQLSKVLLKYQTLMNLQKSNPEMFSINNTQNILMNNFILKAAQNNPQLLEMFKRSLVQQQQQQQQNSLNGNIGINQANMQNWLQNFQNMQGINQNKDSPQQFPINTNTQKNGNDLKNNPPFPLNYGQNSMYGNMTNLNNSSQQFSGMNMNLQGHQPQQGLNLNNNSRVSVNTSGYQNNLSSQGIYSVGPSSKAPHILNNVPFNYKERLSCRQFTLAYRIYFEKLAKKGDYNPNASAYSNLKQNDPTRLSKLFRQRKKSSDNLTTIVQQQAVNKQKN